MKNIVILLVILLKVNAINAQFRGNYQNEDFLISRQNILSGGNGTSYNPAIQQQLNNSLDPSDHLFIDLKALQNVKATTYTAIFNISQIGVTADGTALIMKERIDKIRSRLNAIGILNEDVVIDVISFVPNYELEVQKKLFSKTYVEVPKGFVLQQNIHIRFTKTNQFEAILAACAQSEVYNLVKVDYYIEDIAEVYKNLQDELLTLVEDKRAYFKALGFDLTKYDISMADDKYCYFPKDFYQSYQAFNSISFESFRKKEGVTTAKKQTSYYYQPLTYENYDLVINPSILEPVTQIGMNVKIKFTPKPKEDKAVSKIETSHKYYIVSPNGTIDIKELKTDAS